MFSNCLFRITAIILITAPSACPTQAWPHKSEQKAKVHFLATSTFIRGTWGWNKDIYLAQILLPKENEATLVRLVDAYPNEFPPLSREVQISQSGTFLRVERDSECDLPFGQMLLRTAPGDPMAILPTRLDYRPQLPKTPAPNDVLPCYRTLRK